MDGDNTELHADQDLKGGAGRRFARLRRAVRNVIQVQEGVGVHA